MRKLTTLLAALAVVCFFGSFANADLDKMDIGGDIKVLGYYGKNVTDFSDDAEDQDDFLRVETHLWFTADLSDNVTTKVSVEVDRDFDYDEENIDDYGSSGDLAVYLEEAYIQIANLYDSAISAKLGRQFIQFGDGFVMGDASTYPYTLNVLGEYEVDPFDALLFWYDGDDWVLNAFAAKVLETRITDEDVDVYGLYFTYSGIEDWVIDVYGLYANMEYLGYDYDYEKLQTIVYADDADADVFAVGARVAVTPVDGLSLKLEGVYEFGEVDFDSDDADIRAWAIEAGGKYVFDTEYKPWIGLTYVFESGDDNEMDDDFEDYDPIFQNRVYGEIFDPWTSTNIHIFNAAAGLDVTEDIAFALKYYYFLADEDWYDDDNLGQELDAYLDYQFSEETSAVLAGGFFAPDDGVESVYDDDTAWFVRAGVKVEF